MKKLGHFSVYISRIKNYPNEDYWYIQKKQKNSPFFDTKRAVNLIGAVAYIIFGYNAKEPLPYDQSVSHRRWIQWEDESALGQSLFNMRTGKTVAL